MKIIKLKNLPAIEYQRIIKRASGKLREIIPLVEKIIYDVRLAGDNAIYEKYQERYGKACYQSVFVSGEEIKEAYKKVSRDFISTINQMIRNITMVHEAQLRTKKDSVIEPLEGIKVWREWRPIEKVGLYIPGGKAIYPSSVLMSTIPAKIAGCREIVMCSPPKERGEIPYPTLVAADMVGIKKIFKVGGPEAIAALAYGTESIPKVYKIFGAGNSYVTAAKLLSLSEVAVDMPAGPSEVLIIADETANPAFIAADLLADGEHGNDSACVLLTTSKIIALEVVAEFAKQLLNLPTAKYIKESLAKYGLIVLVDSIKEAINFANEYAPEHLELMVKNPEKIINKILNAGSVFLGDWTSKSAGDYATGANHVLPTGGTAKMYPPLGVDAFGKWMQVQKCTKTGLKNIKQTVETISEVEQLPAHKNATSIRFL